MSKLIRNGHVVSDGWKILALAAYETPQRVKLPVGPLLVPLAVWRARRAELIQREYEHGWPLGVWLNAQESAEALARDIDDFSVIAQELKQAEDKNGHANARLLREYGYGAELRAIGAVSHDELAELQRSGFDAFALSADKNPWADFTDWFNFAPAASAPTLGAAAA